MLYLALHNQPLAGPTLNSSTHHLDQSALNKKISFLDVQHSLSGHQKSVRCCKIEQALIVFKLFRI